MKYKKVMAYIDRPDGTGHVHEILIGGPVSQVVNKHTAPHTRTSVFFR